MNCEIEVFNVGHGDAIAVTVDPGSESPFSMLIDGGERAANIRQQLLSGDVFLRAGKHVIDLLVATHHDRDHIAGLIDVVDDEQFEIRQAWAPVVFQPSFDPAYTGVLVQRVQDDYSGTKATRPRLYRTTTRAP